MYTDFEDITSSPVLSMATSSSSGWTAVAMENDKRDHDLASKLIHPLTLRPWDITVLLNVYKVHAKLPVVSRITYTFFIMSNFYVARAYVGTGTSRQELRLSKHYILGFPFCS